LWIFEVNLMIFGFGKRPSMMDRAMVQMEPSQKKPVVGLIMAAGRSERFDPTGERSKLLADIDGMPTLGLSISSMTAVLDDVIVVVRRGIQREAIERIVKAFGAHSVICEDAASGMGHSIAWGISQAQALYDPRAIVIGLADMPLVSSMTISALVSHIREPHEIAVPRFNGDWGNPVAFGSDHFEALGRLSGDRGARSIIEKKTPLFVDVDDAGILQDIDTVQDLKRLNKQL
jgi:molybdenum cofactor cytidylyltransferase